MIEEGELIKGLYEQGLSPEGISRATGLTITVVRDTLSQTYLLPTEEDIRERAIRLTNEAFNEAFKIIRMGPSSQRIPMIRTLISNASKTLGKDSAEDLQQLRLALERLLGQNRIESIQDADIAELNSPS